LAEIEEGVEESILLKVALAELAGGGRNGQATAAVIQIARGIAE
jgi:ribosomal protein S9